MRNRETKNILEILIFSLPQGIKALLFGFTFILYLVLLFPLFPVMEHSVFMLSFLPVMLSAFFWGTAAGIGVMLAAAVITAFFFEPLTPAFAAYLPKFIGGTLLSFLAVVFIGKIRKLTISMFEECRRIEKLEKEQLLQKELLEQRDKRLSQIFNNAGFGIYRTTPDGKILMANPAAAKILKYPDLDTFLAQNLENPEHNPLYKRDYFKQRLEEDNKIVNLENQCTAYDGSIIYIRESAWTNCGKNGVLYYDGIIEDITESMKATLELKKSEKRFRSIFENANAGIYRRSPDGTILMANQELLNYLVNISHEDLKDFNPEDTESIKKYKNSPFYKELIDSEKLLAWESKWKSSGGDYIYFSENAWTVRDSAGKLLYIEGILQDITGRKQAEKQLDKYVYLLEKEITERKKAQETLRESEERYRDLVEQAGIAITIDDAEGNIKYYNSEFSKLFGYEKNDSELKNIGSLIHPYDKSWVMNFHIDRIKGRDVPSRYEFRGMKKDGSTVYVEVYSVLLMEGSVFTGTRSYLWDITERKKQEEERNNLVSELRNALNEVKKLSGLLPICSRCKSIRDDTGYWLKLEEYVSTHSDAQFSHGLCPSCMQELYPDYFEDEDNPAEIDEKKEKPEN